MKFRRLAFLVGIIICSATISKASMVRFYSWGTVVDQAGSPISFISGNLCINGNYCVRLITNQFGQYFIGGHVFSDGEDPCYGDGITPTNLTFQATGITVSLRSGLTPLNVWAERVSFQWWTRLLDAGLNGRAYCREDRIYRLRINTQIQIPLSL